MYSPQEIKAAGLDDFRVFLRQVWDYLGLPEPTPVQYDIARWLQHGPKRAQLSAFRGVGKSWITVAFVLWILFNDGEKKIMVVSASESLAKDFTTFTKQLINGMPLLQHLAPRPGQRDSVEKFDVGPARDSKDPSVKSVGITGQITGSRADIIIADDIEVPKNSYTHLLRERLAELVKEFDSVIKPLDESRIIYLGTPQVEDSLYMKLIQRNYRMQVWPAEIPAKPENYGGRLAPFVQRLIRKGVAPGTPVDPKRFDVDDLEERLISYASSGYALQFMLDTNPSEAEKHPLKLKDLIIADVDPEMGPVKIMWSQEPQYTIRDLPAGGFDGDHYVRPFWTSGEMTRWQGTVCAIDPSGRGSDETSYAIVKLMNSQLYLVEVGGFTDGFSPETLDAIADACKRHDVGHVIIETNYGGGMFNQLFKPVLSAKGRGRIDDEWNGWSSGQKELRILDTLEPIVKNHRLVVSRRVIESDSRVQQDNKQNRYSFIQQFTRIERTKGCLPNEDRLEAVALACSYWVSKMDRDQEKAVDRHKDRIQEEDLREFRKHVFSVSGKAGKNHHRW